jgi:hypothetical protein
LELPAPLRAGMDLLHQKQDLRFLVSRLRCLRGGRRWSCASGFGRYKQHKTRDETHSRESKSGWATADDQAQTSADR